MSLDERKINSSGDFWRTNVDDSSNLTFFQTKEIQEEVTEERKEKIEEMKKRVFSGEDEELEDLLKEFNSYLNDVFGEEINLQDKIMDNFFFYSFYSGQRWVKKDDHIFKLIKQHIKWRINMKEELLYNKPEEFKKVVSAVPGLLDSAFAFNFGYTKDHFPIIWIKLANYKPFFSKGKAHVIEAIKLACFITQDIKQYFPKGKKRIVMIIDAHNVGFDLISSTYKCGIKVANHCMEFPDILESARIVNCSFVITALWKVISTFLDKKIGSKYRFYKNNEIISELVDPDQTPTHFGGNVNMENYSLSQHIDFVTEEHKNRKKKEKKSSRTKAF